MTTFYVTFGTGSILADYYLQVAARSEDIVRAWMNAKSGIRCWSCVYSEQPGCSRTPIKCLNERPLELHYEDAAHIF